MTPATASSNRSWRQVRRLNLALTLTLTLAAVSHAPAALAADAAPWADALRTEVERIDRATPGELGVYIKRLDTGETLSYGTAQRWYLGSTVKLPVALAVLQEVEAGTLALDRMLTLKDTDKTDGSGNVVWQASGTRYRVDDLLKRMLMDSDNTAADMLVRAIGLETLNKRAKTYLGADGVGQLTDFAAVRYDVYAELHPSARQLPNIELVKIAAAPLGPQRVETLRRTLKVERNQLLPTLDEAYARYYARGLNSATLQAYGGMLEQMVRGKLVSAAHTQLLFKDLKYDTYDAYRLEAGLPRNVRFIHKTGTQFQRACHMGVIEPQDGGRRSIVVVSCAQGLDEHADAGRAFEQIGRAITQTMLPGMQPGTPASPQPATTAARPAQQQARPQAQQQAQQQARPQQQAQQAQQQAPQQAPQQPQPSR